MNTSVRETPQLRELLISAKFIDTNIICVQCASNSVVVVSTVYIPGMGMHEDSANVVEIQKLIGYLVDGIAWDSCRSIQGDICIGWQIQNEESFPTTQRIPKVAHCIG